jgi:hypothetical protein
MKKICVLATTICFAFLFSCGFYVNGEEVGGVENPLADKYIDQCNLRLTFYSALDEQTNEEFWKYVIIDNFEDADAKLWIFHENGGYVLGGKYDGTYIGANARDYKPVNEIYIEMGEKITIHIERVNADTGEWEQCGEDKEYKMDY